MLSPGLFLSFNVLDFSREQNSLTNQASFRSAVRIPYRDRFGSSMAHLIVDESGNGSVVGADGDGSRGVLQLT